MRSLLAVLVLAAFAMPALAQPYALAQLENSPRHHEWIEVTYDERTVHAFVAYPEADVPTATVLVIHENRGLNDWARSFADQVAAAGYLAVAVDLLSGFDAEHEKTSDFETSDAARAALYERDQPQITADLQAVKAHIATMPAANGTLVVAGFCWGGKQSFQFATDADDLDAAMVFYGSPPEMDALADIDTPVYGFYGEDDARINATIPNVEKQMGKLGKTYDYVIYPGAGHAFMRRGDDPEAASDDPNRLARDAAWLRLTGILAALDSPDAED